MTVLCDYSVIQAGRVVIGNGSDPNDPNIEFEKDGSAFGKGSPMFSKKFNTDGRHDAQAVLMINVQGLTDGNAVVFVNNKPVNPLTPSPQGNSSQTFTQHMVLPSDLLSPTGGNNLLVIKRVLEGAGVNPKDFDDFVVRDIVCFFKQSA